MGAIYNSGIPIVFKGAMVINAILCSYAFDEFKRETTHIDANWVSKPPTMEYIVNSINRALSALGGNLVATAKQEYTDTQSARIAIASRETGIVVTTMDIKIKPVKDSNIYYCEGTSFRGVLVNVILADKLSVLSSDKIFRRAKDFLDVYALSRCVDINVLEILETCEREERVIGSFEAFFNRKADLEHAYNMLKRIDNKPDFDIVYNYMVSFVRPFVQ